jgi:hypothetical protein
MARPNKATRVARAPDYFRSGAGDAAARIARLSAIRVPNYRLDDDVVTVKREKLNRRMGARSAGMLASGLLGLS